jgi:hypothetical protein
VYWCPKDIEARNALALACFQLHDLLEAQRQWREVLALAPGNALALQGIQCIETQQREGIQLESISALKSSAALPARPDKKGLFQKKKKSTKKDSRL